MKHLLPLFVIALGAFPVFAQTAEEIMRSVRQVTTLQEEQNLHGSLRKGGKKTPLSLFLRGKNIQFALDGGKERFHLRLEENRQDLFELVGGKTKKFPVRKISQPIADTDVSYEDLALKFLYWPNPSIAEEVKINRQDCWRIHMRNPEKSGRYREISVYVSKRHRALMRVIGYGPRPAAVALKQFEITKLMKVNDSYTVKTMKVSSFNENRRVKGITYIEFKKEAR